MVKTILIPLDEETHIKYSFTKGKKTWNEVLEIGIKQIEKEE